MGIRRGQHGVGLPVQLIRLAEVLPAFRAQITYRQPRSKHGHGHFAGISALSSKWQFWAPSLTRVPAMACLLKPREMKAARTISTASGIERALRAPADRALRAAWCSSSIASAIGRRFAFMVRSVSM
jgi:hypothetical protein